MFQCITFFLHSVVQHLPINISQKLQTHLFLKYFIEFIGVTLVNTIMQVSGVQFYNTSSVYCTVCSPPQVKLSSIVIFPPFTLVCLPHPSGPSGHHHTLVCVYEVFIWPLLLYLFPPGPPTPHPSDSCQSVLCIYQYASILIVSLFCSLDSTYK